MQLRKRLTRRRTSKHGNSAVKSPKPNIFLAVFHQRENEIVCKTVRILWNMTIDRELRCNLVDPVKTVQCFDPQCTGSIFIKLCDMIVSQAGRQASITLEKCQRWLIAVHPSQQSKPPIGA